MKTNTQPTARQRGFTLIELLVVISIIATLAALSVPAIQTMLKAGKQTEAINNCRQVIMAMKQYAQRNGSQYPDAATDPVTGNTARSSNEAFRSLIRQRIVSEEKIFGAPAGYKPNGVIGTSPGYEQALLPGEVHWAITAGLTDTSDGGIPLVYENPAEPTWPPKWNASVAGQIRPGRTWVGSQIVIGRQDCSVSIVDLDGAKGLVTVPTLGAGLDMFTQPTEGSTLNVLMPELPGSTTGKIPSPPNPPGEENKTRDGFPPLLPGSAPASSPLNN